MFCFLDAEKCVLGGVKCECSDDMELVPCNGMCIKQLDEVQMLSQDLSKDDVIIF